MECNSELFILNFWKLERTGGDCMVKAVLILGNT